MFMLWVLVNYIEDSLVAMLGSIKTHNVVVIRKLFWRFMFICKHIIFLVPLTNFSNPLNLTRLS